MNRLKLLFIVLLPVVLSACASLSQTECLNADWQAIGFDDGQNGRDLTYVQDRNNSCLAHSVTPDQAQYQSGYEAGLAHFCTAAKGSWLGESGQEFKDVCPAELDGEYRKAYEKGHSFFMMLEELD